MWSDAGFLAVFLIMIFWIGLVFVALATNMGWIRKRRAKPADTLLSKH
ncbi:MAG: hypothetical protein V4598_04580 [Bdellovibrionota bacterium]